MPALLSGGHLEASRNAKQIADESMLLHLFGHGHGGCAGVEDGSQTPDYTQLNNSKTIVYVSAGL